MVYHFIDTCSPFPDVNRASPEGIVAIGGDLSVKRMLDAYSKGIFPWYTRKEPILWWSPNPRFVIMKRDFHISRSLNRELKKETYEITINKAFLQVINGCSRKDESKDEQWLHKDIIEAYYRMHQAGRALSVEAWEKGQLVGGIYGVITGSVFSGESMFSQKKNASKSALAVFGKRIFQQGFTIIDCQIHSDHLETFGGKHIPRREFLKHLEPPHFELAE